MKDGWTEDIKTKNSAEESLPKAQAPYRKFLKKEIEKWKANDKVRKLSIPNTPPVNIEDKIGDLSERVGQSKGSPTLELTDECRKGVKRNSDANELPKRSEGKSEADDENLIEKLRRKTDEFPIPNEIVNYSPTGTICIDLPPTCKPTKSSADLQRINESNEWNQHNPPVLFRRKMPMNDACEGHRDQLTDLYGKSPWFSFAGAQS